MKCEICGSDIMTSDIECKYCGNKIKSPFLKTATEKRNVNSFDAELDTPKAEFVRRQETKYSRICKYCGRDLNPYTLRCDFCDDQPKSVTQQDEDFDTDYTEETEMANKKNTKKNTKKNKKGNPFLTAFIITLSMVILFAASFTIFFRMLGGSFEPEAEEIVTPSPKPTPQVTRVVQTPEPTQEPTKAPKKTQEATEKPTEQVKQSAEPEKTENEKKDVLNSERNSYAYPSDEKLISESELEDLTRQEVKIILQEIYARHGYTFNDDDLIEYFENKSWYMPTETDAAEVEEQFNEIEQENKEIIEEYQKKQGWRI